MTAGGEEVRGYLARQESEVRRAAALTCGCGCSAARAARIMRLSQNRVRSELNDLLRALQEKFGYEDARSARRALTASVRRSFREKNASMPPVSAIYQSFMREIEQEKPSRHLPSRIIRGIFAMLMVVICIFMIWLAAVLIQPDPLETAASGADASESAQP